MATELRKNRLDWQEALLPSCQTLPAAVSSLFEIKFVQGALR